MPLSSSLCIKISSMQDNLCPESQADTKVVYGPCVYQKQCLLYGPAQQNMHATCIGALQHITWLQKPSDIIIMPVLSRLPVSWSAGLMEGWHAGMVM